MPYCHPVNPSAPLLLTLLSRLFETLLAKIVCFFDALERLIPPYTLVVTFISIGWSIDQYGVISGALFGIPLGMVMALVHGLAIVVVLFLLGLLLWLALIPIYFIASRNHKKLPTVLEHNPTVQFWMQRCSRRTTQRVAIAPHSTTKQISGLMIGVLLGNWLMD